MEKLPNCPYSVSQSKGERPVQLIRDDFDFQYNENHEVEVVKVGETDLVKEINSHANEVGLVNVIKMAIAHGENPYEKFKKTEDGINFAVDPNATLEDIKELQKSNDDKLAEIAKSLGVSTLDLVKSMRDGSINYLIKKASEKQQEDDKGGVE